MRSCWLVIQLSYRDAIDLHSGINYAHTLMHELLGITKAYTYLIVPLYTENHWT